MTDDLGMHDQAEAIVTRGDVAASWLVRIVARRTEGGASLPPTNEQLEHAITTMVSASWQGLSVTATAERTDR